MAETTIIFVGILVSLAVQWIKKYLKSDEYITLSVVAGLSILSAIVFTVADAFGFIPALLQILGTAGAFYAFIIKRFEE